MAGLSPMMIQYFDIKNQHKDHILFYRLGDFYEMFFDDALIASKELELTLTGRDCGLDERAPMCGVPYHSAENYIAKLIKKGYKVAICEQMEDPAAAKGVVKREVIRVITPGTLIETNMLDEASNNFICSVYISPSGAGLVFADISTGFLQATDIKTDCDKKLLYELGRFMPNEIIFNQEFLNKDDIAKFLKDRLKCSGNLLEDTYYDINSAVCEIKSQFSAEIIDSINLLENDLIVRSLGALLMYLKQTQFKGLERLISIDYYTDEQYMNLDITAKRNLELTETMISKEKRGSLLWVLDKTKTAMGKRLLRSYIEKPLVNPSVINKRLNAVEELVENTSIRTEVAQHLAGIFDIERLMTKIIYGSATPRELKTLEQAIGKLPAVKTALVNVKCSYLTDIYNNIDELYDVYSLLSSSIVETPPNNLKDGGVIASGYNSELDELRELVSHTKEILTSIETSEKEKTGIKNLKIGYTKVFGYYIEVTRSYLDLVPETYIRKQTLANCERYITEELKNLEEKILSASENIIKLEAALFEEIRCKIASEISRIQNTASAISRLDVYCSFANVAVQNNYCKPNVNLASEINIKEGRHPVVELLLSGAPFVSNDVVLDNGKNQIAIITGPNMAGKSTYMRQVALIVLMAQIGCFVPAAYADIGIVDGIYTRVGASDDLSSGQSTFMVEMSEVASILSNATRKSLLILDEIGRGTSTFDGMSIARAVIEYIADNKKLGAKTLFATHYHELTSLEQQLSCVKNYNIAVKKRGEDITFLRRIVPGGADDSYGIEVSKLAGIPNWIIKRSYQILEELEQGKAVASYSEKGDKSTEKYDYGQISLDLNNNSRVEEELRKLDINVLTPIEALTKLYELKNLLK
ncbi:MAG TPA: DNA mismatch repair protein MutS [Ruminococcaceae bacterium]|nr:DNA mismatch repair protein MutS [Oscillospiraceae bacterium]